MSNIPPKSSRTPRWIRRLGWLLLWIVTLCVLAVVIENYRGRIAWREFVAESESQGERLDKESAIPPPVPEKENFAAAPLFHPLFDFTGGGASRGEVHWRDPVGKEALKHLDPLPTSTKSPRSVSWRDGKFVDLAGYQEEYRSQPGFPRNPEARAPGEDVLFALSRFEKEYSQLRDACARPKSRFPARYEDNVATLMPHLSVLRQFAQISRLRAVSELSLDRSEAAFEDLGIGIRISESIEGEPSYLSVLVRVGLIEFFAEPLWEGLQRHAWTEPQLGAIDDRLKRINLAAAYQSAIRGERNLFAIPVMDSIRKNPRLFLSLEAGPAEPPPAAIVLIHMVPAGWWEQNKVAMCRGLGGMLTTVDPAARRFFPERATQTDAEVQLSPRGLLRPYTVMRALALPSAVAIAHKCAASQDTVGLARIAIALERHRIRHGTYPSLLDQLDHDLTANGLPSDAAAGHAAHFRKDTDSTFTLYFEGWNCVDDGGVTVEKSGHPDYQKGDWVWPQLVH